jgi:hypothetical protein
MAPRRRLLLPQQQVDDPAAAYVFAGFAAVTQDVGVVTASYQLLRSMNVVSTRPSTKLELVKIF